MKGIANKTKKTTKRIIGKKRNIDPTEATGECKNKRETDE